RALARRAGARRVGAAAARRDYLRRHHARSARRADHRARDANRFAAGACRDRARLSHDSSVVRPAGLEPATPKLEVWCSDPPELWARAGRLCPITRASTRTRENPEHARWDVEVFVGEADALLAVAAGPAAESRRCRARPDR